MEVNYLVIILVILLIAALGYIWYFRFHKKDEFNYPQKHVRFADDNMSFLEPGYEQRRIDEMNYDIKYD